MTQPTTPPDPDATVVTVQLDVTDALRVLARLVVRGLVAHAAADDLDDRNGPYIPDLPRKVPPRFGEHEAAGPPTRLVSRGCPSCGAPFLAESDAPADTLCATCQQHGDLRDRE